MKKTFKRLIAVLLLASMLIPALIGCTSNGNEKVTSSEVTEAQTDAPKTFMPTGQYYIVRSEYMMTDKKTIETMSYLREAFETVYGATPKSATDLYRESEGIIPKEYEILIGYTNRHQSEAAYASLGTDDYTYFIESENVIVICGGSPEATLEAAKKFCADAFDYDPNSGKYEKRALTKGMSYTYRAEYDYSTVTVNGISIEEYTIGIKSMSGYMYASELAQKLGTFNGYRIPVKLLSALTGSEKAVICVGTGGRDGEHIGNLGSSTYHISTVKESDSLTSAIDYQYNDLQSVAIGRYIEELKIKKSTDSVEITLPDDCVGYTFEDSIPKWILSTSKEEELTDGVTYIKQEYKDTSGKPYVAYILIIDPNKATLYLGTANDAYDYSLSGITKQTTAGHMKAAVANGIDVIAGINASFFDISGDYHPRGLTIKQGKIIASIDERPWCGITTDGEFVFGNESDYKNKYQGKLVTAVAGSHLIVNGGIPNNLAIDTEFSYTSHPRTLAGVTADGKIILAVVDGRQSSISNGAPLARCAMLMISLGAETAINLDGGGSSCMVIKSGNSYLTKNSPSDGSLRKIHNSLLVVKK